MNTRPPDIPGLMVAGTAVVLSGPAAAAAAEALLIAVRARRVNGLPPSRHYAAIAAALMSATGHTDVRDSAISNAGEMNTITPTMPVENAARHLGLSQRQARRLAPRLGGRIIGGRWLLDPQAVAEHAEGSRRG